MNKLSVVSFLAPNQLPLQRFIAEYMGRKLGYKIEFAVGKYYEQIYDFDMAFICGLPYVLRTHPRRSPSPIEAIAAPVLIGERYQGKPIYFSDVIVKAESDYQSFADLRGCSWAYNEPESQSGYGITRYHLLTLGETNGYFGTVIQAAFHQEAIRMVARGEIDAAAIDSYVLALELRDHPELAPQIRIIDQFGPSTIQPVTVRIDMPDSLKRDIGQILAEMHQDEAAKEVLHRDFIERLVAVGDGDYDDIRAMQAACEAANFLILK